MIKLPYAIRDFDKLISDGFIYLDRTDRIPVMEKLGYELLLLRPRRFGKSLWLSVLHNYYDVAKADEFDRLFGNFFIGQNPTPLRNQFMILRWDFSAVESHGTTAEIRRSLYNHINEQIAIFGDDYPDLLNSPIRINPDDALASFQSLVAAARRSPYKLYLLIDEYDNFANEVMMGTQGQNAQRYDELVSSEGLLKTLFKVVKTAGSGAGLDRVFMTGVSPIVMNDVTSGANVTKNISWHPALNDLCGFREEEVRDLVQQIGQECTFSEAKVAEVTEQIRIFYDGSRFSTRLPRNGLPSNGLPSSELSSNGIDHVPQVYNPTLAFYLLEEIQEFCLYPDNMLDGNLAPDYQKLVYISGFSVGEKLLSDALDETKQVAVTDLTDRWGVKELMDPEQQRERLASLLCYLGALTATSKRADSKIILEIPNLVMRRLYAERILKLTFKEPGDRDEAQIAADMLFAHGNIDLLCDFVEKHLLTVYENRDYRHFNELTVKTLFIALLHYNNLYIMDSEPAIQRQYGDLIMMIRPEMRYYQVFDLLIEFKYIRLKDEELRDPEKSQQSLSGQEVRQKSRSELVTLPSVKKALSDAQIQLRGYRKALEKKYGDSLKLRTYVVVAIGAERLIREEVTDD